ncbi:MAG: hypothetical protein HY938_11770 [Nitrosomonadales bacterium]|nr:hypothetical protein [Nitrosomonadales bacterium]
MCEILSFIVDEVAKTIVALITTAVVSGIVWLITLKNRTMKIRALISNPSRSFIFYYRGETDLNKNKTIMFNQDGTIGDGSNGNEHRWSVSYGTLKIFSSGNVKFSEFKWDSTRGLLVHTNDPRLPSAMGQFIVPSFIPADSQKNIYAK